MTNRRERRVTGALWHPACGTTSKTPARARSSCIPFIHLLNIEWPAGCGRSVLFNVLPPRAGAVLRPAFWRSVAAFRHDAQDFSIAFVGDQIDESVGSGFDVADALIHGQPFFGDHAVIVHDQP